MDAIAALIENRIDAEGGYQKHPHDRSGAGTKFGITQEVYDAWRTLRRLSLRDVVNLTRDEARQIYHDDFIVEPRFDKIRDPWLRLCVVDFGIHSGPPRAARFLQEIVGVKVDGIVGPITLAAVNGSDGIQVGLYLCAKRQKFLARLISRDSTQRSFAAGWMNRIADILLAIPARMEMP